MSDWPEDRTYVIKSLDRNEKDHAAIDAKLDQLIADVGGLKVKAGVWGALAAMIPTIGAILFILLKG